MFVLPEDLALELYPLAWLVGTWRGEGVLSYPGIGERPFHQEMAFTHDGGPYLSYTSTIRVTDEDPAVVWAAESGYWRVSTSRPPELTDGQFPLEVMMADPTGRVSIYVGAVQSGRIDLVSDVIARTATASEVTASKRLYGLVEGKLMWVWELAAFGQSLQSYASASMDRVDGPPAEDPTATEPATPEPTAEHAATEPTVAAPAATAPAAAPAATTPTAKEPGA